ncbi:MAG: hypothetical protein V2A79_18195 [Planctomycetota bacterium]
MNHGGIFGGPNALGTAGFGAVGTSCTPDNTGLIKGIQQYLRTHGAPNLRVDGVWQGCTASAWNKVFGHPWVTCAEITTATGLSCSSNDCLGPMILSLSVPAMFQCTDGSDFGGPGQEATKCPAGQAWNATLGYCLPTGIPGTPPPQQQPPPTSGGCPAGSYSFLGQCIPNPLATPPADTKQPASGACPEGQIGFPPACFPNPLAPAKTQGQNCPSGSILTPAGCASTTSPGTVTTPTPCPEGQMQIPFLGTCVPNPLAQIPGGGATPAAGGCPAGQIGFPPACFPNPLASQTPGQPTDIMGGIMGTIGKIFGGGTQCPAGTIFNPISGQCTGAAGPVPPIVGPVGPVEPLPSTPSPFGNMGYVVLAALAVGVAAVGYYVYKRQAGGGEGVSDAEFQALLASEGLGGDMGGYGDMGGGYDEYTYPNRRRGKRRHRKGKKSGRGRRGRGRR